MKYQIQKSKDASSVEFKYEIDGIMERTKINIMRTETMRST
jgi:hypothetical protein